MESLERSVRSWKYMTLWRIPWLQQTTMKHQQHWTGKQLENGLREVLSLVKTFPECSAINYDWEMVCSQCLAELRPRSDLSYIPDAPVSNEQTTTTAKRSVKTKKEPAMARLESYLVEIRNNVQDHRAGLAGVLSALLPGLGQLYAGSIGRGVAVIVMWIIVNLFYIPWCWDSMSPKSYSSGGLGFWHVTVGIIMLGFWIWNIADAQERTYH